MRSPIIPAPREPLVDVRNGAISRAWNLFLNQLRSNGDEVADAAVLTGDDQTASFANSLVLTPVTGELERLLDPATFTLGLADTTVTAASYGDASHLVTVTFDAKGRATGATVSVLESGNVTETTNKFYTDARARAAISGTAPVTYVPATGVISLAASGVVAGTYAPPASITVDAFGRVTAIS